MSDRRTESIRRRLRIDRLGARGDGVADAGEGQVHVPLTLPGELVDADVVGDLGALVGVVEASPLRRAPPCAHFGDCGGCALQHLTPAAYLEVKRRQVVDALAARGIAAEVAAPVEVAEGGRRRAVFAAARTPAGVTLGFHARRSHRIAPVSHCVVADPALVALLPALRSLAAVAAPRKDALAIAATRTATGPDVALSGARELSGDERFRLVEAARAAGLARLAVNGEVVAEFVAPVLAVGRASLTPPPGGFLQASAAAEAAMAALAVEALAGARSVVDLFCGSGAFALRLAERAGVHAVDAEAAALEALSKAARAAPGLKALTVERRDLFRRPLGAEELNRFAAAVLDPPRAGAEAQTRRLAASKLARVVMVSCNPATLARDLRILIDGGFRLGRVTPVDQFLYSAHVEVVAELSR